MPLPLGAQQTGNVQTMYYPGMPVQQFDPSIYTTQLSAGLPTAEVGTQPQFVFMPGSMPMQPEQVGMSTAIQTQAMPMQYISYDLGSNPAMLNAGMGLPGLNVAPAMPGSFNSDFGLNARVNPEEKLREAMRTIQDLSDKLQEKTSFANNAKNVVMQLNRQLSKYRGECTKLDAACQQYKKELEANLARQNMVDELGNAYTEVNEKCAKLEMSCQLYERQNQELKERIRLFEGQDKVITSLGEQVDEYRNKCAQLEDSCMRFQVESEESQVLKQVIADGKAQIDMLVERIRTLEMENQRSAIQLERAMQSQKIPMN